MYYFFLIIACIISFIATIYILFIIPSRIREVRKQNSQILKLIEYEMGLNDKLPKPLN